MKVIFLDVDGVLNYHSYREAAVDYYSNPIEESRMFLLKYLVEKTGAVIVLSSTWRLYWSEDESKLTKEGKHFNKIFEKYGLKIFYGLETRLLCINTEFMLYGFDKEFLHRYPKLYDLTQKELFDLSKEYNLFMYQTHPFRDGVTAGDPQYLHGAESFNGHYHHRNKNALANEFCDRYNLIKMSGTDFHHEGQPITAGIYIPEEINTNRELTDFLLKGKFELIEQKDDYKQALVGHKKTQGIIIDINDKEL
jgi:hypothetical protein